MSPALTRDHPREKPVEIIGGVGLCVVGGVVEGCVRKGCMEYTVGREPRGLVRVVFARFAPNLIKLHAVADFFINLSLAVKERLPPEAVKAKNN